jgi:hypothetical protein
MIYLEAPQRTPITLPSLFLAGGITGCPDWQEKVCSSLQHLDIAVLNPRRKNFPIHDPNASYEQIKWEYDFLKTANAILFWFPCETLCPIVLYELGAWSMTHKPIFVGAHPDYARRIDVVIQTNLARPEVNVRSSWEELCVDVELHFNEYYTIRNTKQRMWLVEYPPGHPLHSLKWAWTFEWLKATRYPSQTNAEIKAKVLEVTDFVLQKESN